MLTKKENSIKLYEGIAPYMGLEKVPQYQKVDLDIEGSKKNKCKYKVCFNRYTIRKFNFRIMEHIWFYHARIFSKFNEISKQIQN